MTDLKSSILEVMENCVRRDMERNGTGYLSTSEVAGRAALSPATVRRILSELEDEGSVECVDASSETSTKPIYWWRLAGYDWSEEAGLFKVEDVNPPTV